MAGWARSIRLFQNLEKILQHMAVLPSGKNRERAIFLKRVFFVVSVTLYISASVAYFWLEAETVAEYSDTFYMFSTEMTATFFSFTYVRKLPEILALIAKFDIFFEKSKLTFSIK